MSVDAVVDERTLREIYLASFEGAVKKGKPWTVMCSYNKVNGTYAAKNKRLLTDILKQEWGHEGFVVSDWGAVDQIVESVAAGLELEMPSTGGIGEQKLVEAVRNGILSEEVLDEAVERILRVIFKSVDGKRKNASYDAAEHHRLARKVASESMVLLKNDDSLLPLKQGMKIAVIGEFAVKPRYQGGGSSHVNPTQLDEPLAELKKLAGEGTEIRYAEGFSIAQDTLDPEQLREALEAAAWADVVVVFAGLPDRYESEGYDRTHLGLPANQSELIEAIAAAHNKVAVVLMSGSPVEMPWIDRVSSVLEAYLGGQAAGGAIADLLFGVVNPSGKLAETFPVKLSDNPSYLFFPGEQDRVEYREGIFVGYRYYDSKNVKPLFPFGHGLSYTTFEYSDLQVDRSELSDTDTLTVTVNVKNTGPLAGKEVVQLYVSDVHSTVIRPAKELKEFAKIELQPGEQKTVSFTLDKRAFAYYNTDIADWHVESGEYLIQIGRSSADLVLQEAVYVHSTVKLPVHYTRNSLVGDLLQDKSKADIVQKYAEHLQGGFAAAAESDHEQSEMFAAMMRYMPLRAMVSFSRGALTDEMLDQMLDELNQA